MKHTITFPTILSMLFAFGSGGCLKKSALFCDEDTPCTDPSLSFCDLNGDFPASEGIGNTCIPSPFADAGAPDAATDGSGPTSWSEVELLPISDVKHVTISDDGLELHFTRRTSPPSTTGMVDHPFRASRATADDEFVVVGLAADFGGLNVDGAEINDTRTEMLVRTRVLVGSGPPLFQRSVRGSSVDNWGPLTDLGFANLTLESVPRLSGDRLTVYYAQNRRVFRASRATTDAAFGPPVEVIVPSLSSELLAGWHSLDISSDELSVLLRFVEPGETGIYVATRPHRDVAFGDPVPVPALSDNIDSAVWNADETEIWVTYNPPGTGEPNVVGVSRLE